MRPRFTNPRCFTPRCTGIRESRRNCCAARPVICTIVAWLRLPAANVAQEARIGLFRAVWACRPAREPFYAFAVSCVRDHTFKAIDTAGTGKHLCSAGGLGARRHHAARAAVGYRRDDVGKARSTSSSNSNKHDRSPIPSPHCSHTNSSTRCAPRRRPSPRRSAPRIPARSTESRSNSSPARRARPKRRLHGATPSARQSRAPGDTRSPPSPATRLLTGKIHFRSTIWKQQRHPRPLLAQGRSGNASSASIGVGGTCLAHERTSPARPSANSSTASATWSPGCVWSPKRSPDTALPEPKCDRP
jgi:hypothetical protein